MNKQLVKQLWVYPPPISSGRHEFWFSIPSNKLDCAYYIIDWSPGGPTAYSLFHGSPEGPLQDLDEILHNDDSRVFRENDSNPNGLVLSNFKVGRYIGRSEGAPFPSVLGEPQCQIVILWELNMDVPDWEAEDLFARCYLDCRAIA